MTSHLSALSFGASDPRGLAQFWAGVLGRELADDGVTLLAGDDLEFPVRFVPTQEPRLGPNQMHFDLTSTSWQDQQQAVARALGLGAEHLDIGQGPEATHVVLADPDGNEFCIIGPGNNFLADTGVIGALSSDGTQAVGYFWSQALDWPLVWDEDEETAIQSPSGGTKISWGGPPVNPKTGRNRLSLDLAVPTGRDVSAEVDRLVALGATRTSADHGEDGSVELADPDGNEFSVTPTPTR